MSWKKTPYKSVCVIIENTISMLAASCQKHLPKLQVHYRHLFYLFLVALFISAGSAGAAFAATALQWSWSTTTTSSATASSSTNSSSRSTSSKQQQQQQQEQQQQGLAAPPPEPPPVTPSTRPAGPSTRPKHPASDTKHQSSTSTTSIANTSTGTTDHPICNEYYRGFFSGSHGNRGNIDPSFGKFRKDGLQICTKLILKSYDRSKTKYGTIHILKVPWNGSWHILTSPASNSGSKTGFGIKTMDPR